MKAEMHVKLQRRSWRSRKSTIRPTNTCRQWTWKFRRKQKKIDGNRCAHWYLWLNYICETLNRKIGFFFLKLHVAFATNTTTFFAQPASFVVCLCTSMIEWNIFNDFVVVFVVAACMFLTLQFNCDFLYLPPASRFLRTKSKFRFVSCFSAIVVTMSN